MTPAECAGRGCVGCPCPCAVANVKDSKTADTEQQYKMVTSL